MNRALTGIVVCGGKSARMGQDKSLLIYYGQAQRYHTVQLLRPFCTNVYLSLNRHQEEQHEKRIIRDHMMYKDLGPMTALLSAYEHLPDENLLFIGCDYPLLAAGELSAFVQSIAEVSKPKAFFNKAENLYEPLLAFYPAGFGKELKDYFSHGGNSLQKLLSRVNAGKYIPAAENAMKSVDDPAQFEKVFAEVNG